MNIGAKEKSFWMLFVEKTGGLTTEDEIDTAIGNVRSGICRVKAG